MDGTKIRDFDGTHNFRGETGGVRKMNDRVIEVKHVCLVMRLKLMKEVEKLEGEDGVRSDQRGREPTPPHQLSAAVLGVFRSTSAVPNDDLMDTTEIEEGELIAPGRVRARLTNTVTELHYETKGGKGFGRKVLTIPSLQKTKMRNRE